MITHIVRVITELCTSTFIHHTLTSKYEVSFTQQVDMDYWRVTIKILVVTTSLRQGLKVTHASTNKLYLQGVSFSPYASGIWSKIATYTSRYLNMFLGSGLRSVQENVLAYSHCASLFARIATASCFCIFLKSQLILLPVMQVPEGQKNNKGFLRIN